MILFREWRYLGLMLLIGACKPPEPTPSQYKNLGTEEVPLLPPPPAWHDPAIVKGTSEWRPFRKPAEVEAKPATGKPSGGERDAVAVEGDEKADGAAGASDAEKEIRSLVADFNTAVANSELEKAAEFLTDAQAQVSGDVFAAVHQLVEQLRLLQTAVPALTEKIDALAPLLDVSGMLKVEVQTVRLVDARNATAVLTDGTEARFVVGEEELWYIESPTMARLEIVRPRMQAVAKDIEEALAKSRPDEAAVTILGATLDELRSALAATSNAPPDSNGT